MPYGWLHANQLHGFSGARGMSGTEIVALKCYLAIAAYHDDRQDETVLSIKDLMGLTGASKPSVIRGLKLLEDQGLLMVDVRADRNTNVYRLAEMENRFRKVPQDLIADNLKNLGNRGAIPLAAVKIYMALLYHRNEEDNHARVSHETLVSETGIRPQDVKTAYKMLYTCGFLHVHINAQVDARSPSGHPTNAYELFGDFRGKRPRRSRPVDAENQRRRAAARMASSSPVDDIPDYGTPF